MPAPLRFWIAATLVGVTAWYVDFALVTWISPPGDAAHLTTFVEELSLGSAAVAIAIAPALTEELFFRGVLARAFARRATAGAIVASAFVFSLYHINPIQIVATFPLGVASRSRHQYNRCAVIPCSRANACALRPLRFHASSADRASASLQRVVLACQKLSRGPDIAPVSLVGEGQGMATTRNDPGIIERPW